MKCIQLLTLLLISNLAISQLSNKHWLPPLHANENLTDNTNPPSKLIQDHYIYLSTPEPIPFEVFITDGGGVPIAGSPFIISQNHPVNVYIGNQQPSVMFVNTTEVGRVISNKGLILEGLYDFYVSFRVKSTSHAEFLSSKGRTGAGNVFRLGSVPQYYASPIRNFVSSFIALENNTNVTLSEYDPNLLFVINGIEVTNAAPQNFTLNAGESVVISGNCDSPSKAANFRGFIGALLTSDKPIVVNTGNLAGGTELFDNGQGSKQDFNLDQIVPLEQVGTEYIVMKGNGSDTTELPLVIAHENNTQIFVNSNQAPIATLNAGEYFLIPTNNFQGIGQNKNMYIQSSKPIFLYQIIGGSNSDATSGFYFIPTLSCFWQKSVDLIPDVNKITPTDNNIQGNIIIATEAGSVVTINGNPTTQNPITVTGNPNWESYRIPNLSGNVKVESTGALAVGVFGTDNGAIGYGGYFSGFGALPKDSETTICSNNIVNLFERITGNPETNGTWTVPVGAPNLNGNLFDPAVNLPGEYIYTFIKICDGTTSPYPIKITVLPIQQGPFAGNDSTKSFCSTDAITDLSTLLGSGVTTGGNWKFNGLTRPDGNLNPSSDLSGNYTYTIPASGVCEAVSATIAVTINPVPQLVTTVTDLEECDDAFDGDTNGITLFTLTNKDNQITNGVTGLTVKYYEDQNDALTNATNNITSIRATSGKIIYFRLSNSNCFIVSSFTLQVNPLPVSLNEVSLKQCDDDTDANTNFNLTDANSIISNDTSLVFSYHNSQSGANNDNDLVANELNHYASNGSVIWARIETNQGCFRVTKVNLVVSTTQIPASFNPAPLEECDDYVDASNLANDGYDNFDIETAFTQLIKDVFPVGQRPFLVVTYYESFNDALLISNPITNPTNFRNTVPNDQPIWVRVDSRLNTDSGCKGIKELQLKVNPLPEFELGDDFVLCVDPNTGIGLEVIDATPTVSGSYNYTWTPTNPNLDAFGNESPLYDITQGGTYSVVVTNTVTGCQNFDNITATFSSEPATFTASVVTPAFSSGLTTIECLATGGYGIYEYSLNLVDWQSSPIFTDLPNGTYTAYVRDLQGCDMLSVGNLFAVTYPNFFTPNGDGYHDTWNIFGLDDSFAANIYIYDRFGKLLKQISPNGEGWNGTFNGQILPSTDYWFRIEYTENNIRKEFKSHFSLIR